MLLSYLFHYYFSKVYFPFAGIAALVTMGLVFRKSINKKKVTPQPDENKNKLESELAWT
jgi:NhaP-type Na+/H+ or K+/H+ antiporter